MPAEKEDYLFLLAFTIFLKLNNGVLKRYLFHAHCLLIKKHDVINWHVSDSADMTDFTLIADNDG